MRRLDPRLVLFAATLAVAALPSVASSAPQVDSDLAATTGTSSSVTTGATYAVDLTVLGTGARVCESLTLRGFSTSTIGVTGTIGARIYDSVTRALVASGQVPLTSFGFQSITVPIHARLAPGQTYTVGFFTTSNAPPFTSVPLLQPTAFPYDDPTGTFRMHGARQTGSDAFPGVTSQRLPKMTLRHRACVAGSFAQLAPGCVRTPGGVAVLFKQGGGAPQIEGTTTLQVSNAPASTPIAGVLLGFARLAPPGGVDLSLVGGPPGCVVHVQSVITLPMTIDAAGTGTTSITHPVQALGLTFFAEGVFFDPANPAALKVVTSSTVEATVGC